MKRTLQFLFSVVFVLSACATRHESSENEKAAQPVALNQAAVEAVVKEIEKDRAETQEWLRSNPLSYLAAVDRIEFGEKHTLTVGRASDNNVVLSDAGVETHHLSVSVDGDQFHLKTVDAKATFKIKDEVKREATLGPSSLQIGRFHLRLSHQRFPAIVVFDPQSSRLKDYKGIAYFPIDLSYRYELSIKLNPQRERIAIMSTRGNQRYAEHIGWVEFLAGKNKCRLEATRLLEPGAGASEIDIFFRDVTSGKTTYSLGRNVDLKKLANGKHLLDFNLAYNPACAFSDYYNCPIPPKVNTLKVEIRAGEKDSHYH